MHSNSSEELADECYWRAVSRYRNREYKAAVVDSEGCLEYVPIHVDCHILLGELYLLHGDQLGFSEEEGDKRAQYHFESALSISPGNADAWSGLALGFLYQDRYEEATAAANRGLAAIDSDGSFGMSYPTVQLVVMESLFDVKIRVFLENGNLMEAKLQLAEALSRCGGSPFLTRHRELREHTT